MDTVMSVLVLVAIALLAGALVLWRRGGPVKQVVLMIVLAIVMAINVAIWAVPDSTGEAMLEREPVAN